MVTKLEIPDEIVNAIATRFGYDQKTADEKLELEKEDFVVQKIAEYLKREAGEHLAGEAAATASKTAKDAIDALEVKRGK